VSEQTPARPKSLAHLIAWLSLCLVVVGWGPSLDPQWRQVWANVGMFGLVAAVAFVVNERALAWRRERAIQREREASREVAERRLDHFAAEDKRLATMLQEAHKVGSAK
jgi:hypothetical protein